MPDSWFLECYHCKTMLEVPHAEEGDVFACGHCQTPLQVVDPDKGITKPPTILQAAPKAPMPSGMYEVKQVATEAGNNRLNRNQILRL